MATKISEEALLKSLDELEAATQVATAEDDVSAEEGDMTKGLIPANMKNQKAANGGFSTEGETPDGMDAGEASSDAEPVAKSLVDGNEQIQETFEVSDFLKSFADVMVEAHEIETAQIMNGISEFRAGQADFNEKMQKAVIEMGNMFVEMKKSMEAQGEQPARQAKTVLNKSEVSERFDTGGQSQYNVSQVKSALIDMAIKGECDTVAVSAYETTGVMPTDLVPVVNMRLGQMFGGNR